jgi:flagellar protein FliL
MATSATPQIAANAAAPAKNTGSKKKLIIIIVLLALVVLGGAAAAYFFYYLPHQGRPSSQQVEKLPPPIFFAIDPFTVNLQSDDGERYLHVGLTLKLSDQNVADALREHMPEIRSRILILLSNKHPADLTSLDGKTTLAREIRAQIETPFAPGTPAEHVNEVLFTDFVVQ